MIAFFVGSILFTLSFTGFFFVEESESFKDFLPSGKHEWLRLAVLAFPIVIVSALAVVAIAVTVIIVASWLAIAATLAVVVCFRHVRQMFIGSVQCVWSKLKLFCCSSSQHPMLWIWWVSVCDSQQSSSSAVC